jgi:hypothetical protein
MHGKSSNGTVSVIQKIFTEYSGELFVNYVGITRETMHRQRFPIKLLCNDCCSACGTSGTTQTHSSPRPRYIWHHRMSASEIRIEYPKSDKSRKSRSCSGEKNRSRDGLKDLTPVAIEYCRFEYLSSESIPSSISLYRDVHKSVACPFFSEFKSINVELFFTY